MASESALANHDHFLALAQRITYPGLTIEVVWETAHMTPSIMGEMAGQEVHCGHYLRVSAPDGLCTSTGEPLPWKGRKWRLSRHMTDWEFVSTALKAILTSLEHEARELFRVDGVAVADSHLDLDRLISFRQSTPDHRRTPTP